MNFTKPVNKTKSIIAIGNFDGYHLGHQKIVQTLMKIARQKKLVSIILTFFPNPKLYFDPKQKLIIPEAEKKKLLKSLKIDRVTVLDFKYFYQMAGDRFIQDILLERFNMAHIVVGSNFRFGYERQNDIDSLERFSRQYGFGLSVVESVFLKGILISSSLIRQKLNEGGVEEANKMLGREYFMCGKVAGGEKRGRQLGFPTINIKAANLILPTGVFRTRVEIHGNVYNSVTNIGYRPTFREKTLAVETHIFGFNERIYGKPVRIFFLKKIRDEIKFHTRHELVEQIRKDIEKNTVDKGA
jgi:riboflavin kinase/FMN adenylyltransferase